MGPVVGVICLFLIVVLLYSIRLMNNRGTTTGSAQGPNRAARAREQAKIRDGLASREALATFATDAPRATRPLGVVFDDHTGETTADGVRVQSVSAGSPAARIGVAGGAWMVAINGVGVTDRATAEAAVAEARAGVPLNLVWRVDGQEHHDSVIL